ncbi:MAG: hypothetical protein II998_02730 [Clostridia bacterium]|nr:hypothetical protein [Clostridia bacterium]
MNIKVSKPSINNKETDDKINALLAYIDNIKTEVDFRLSSISGQINTIIRSVDKLKGGAQ